MKVHLYTLCWDEADMLPFFFRHYDPWVDRYVVYDDGSTDGSIDILSAHPRVELRRFVRTTEDSFVISHQELQDEVWKESRGHADWVVITALDEHLSVRRTQMSTYLAEQRDAGVTYIPAIGFQMVADEMPQGDVRLADAIRTGAATRAFNKLSIFDPNALKATGYGAGRHLANPKGRLKRPARQELILMHFKYVGFRRTLERFSEQRQRLGPLDRRHRYGRQYNSDEAELSKMWNDLTAAAIDLQTPGFDPVSAAKGPFWWAPTPAERVKRLLRPLRRVLPKRRR